MNDLYIKVKGDAGYQRNPDWITMPTITEDDNIFYGLFIVFENEYNELNIQGSNLNQCLIDWGDGSTPILTDGSVQSKVYEFNQTLPNNTIYQWEDGRNYKQVMVEVTPQDNNTGQLYFNAVSGINNGGNVNFVDIICAFKDNNIRLNLSGINNQKRARILKIFKCLNTGISTLFYDENAFRDLDVEVFETQNGDLIGNLNSFNNSTLRGNFRDLIHSNVSAFNSITLTKPIRDIIVSGTLGFRLCKIPSCRNILDIAGRDSFFEADIDILGDVTITTTTFTRLFQNCTTRRLNVISMPSTPTGVATSGGAFSGMRNLQEMVLPGFKIGFDISNSNMLAPALDALFASLGDADGAQTIIITGNPGASTCDTSIATNKGYTVII